MALASVGKQSGEGRMGIGEGYLLCKETKCKDAMPEPSSRKKINLYISNQGGRAQHKYSLAWLEAA
jgi:hypothetical protein